MEHPELKKGNKVIYSDNKSPQTNSVTPTGTDLSKYETLSRAEEANKQLEQSQAYEKSPKS